MDKERLRKQAEGFNGYGDCFIHTEMKNGVKIYPVCDAVPQGNGITAA